MRGGADTTYVFRGPHFLLDFRYLFSANAYTGITLGTFWQVLSDTLLDGAWMGKTLVALALVTVVGWLVGLLIGRSRNPLVVALLLWTSRLRHATFLVYHANLQPRYYLVLAVPLLTLLVALGFDAMLALALAEIAAGSRDGRGCWRCAGVCSVGECAADDELSAAS